MTSPIDEGLPQGPASPGSVSFADSLDDMPLIDRVRNFVLRGTNGVVTDDDDDLSSVESANVEIKSVLMNYTYPNIVGTNGDDDKGDKGKPEAEVAPVPAIVADVPSIAELKVKPKLTPPHRSDEVDVHAQSLRRHGITDQTNMSVTTETLGSVEVTCDPRLGHFTTYYWREQAEMQKYYELPIEFSTLPGAGKFGINFANEMEEEHERQVNLGRTCSHMRSRHTQTRPPIVHTNDAEVQFQVPALDAQTQFQISANDAEVQTEFHSRLDNFGLTPGLSLVTVIRATRQRGAGIVRLVHRIETEYCSNRNRSFTEAERSNVWAVVRMAAATRREEDRELSEWESSFQADAGYGNYNVAARDNILQILCAGQTWDIPDDILYETRSPSLSVSEPPLRASEGVRSSMEGHLGVSDALNAQPTEPTNDGVDPYDDW